MTSTITPIKTIVEPVGISNSDEMIKPANIENSENSIEYKIVFLKLLPIGILVATGMISNPETSNTPIISIKIEITIASITVINIEYTRVFIPETFAKVSSKHMVRIGRWKNIAIPTTAIPITMN